MLVILEASGLNFRWVVWWWAMSLPQSHRGLKPRQGEATQTNRDYSGPQATGYHLAGAQAPLGRLIWHVSHKTPIQIPEGTAMSFSASLQENRRISNILDPNSRSKFRGPETGLSILFRRAPRRRSLIRNGGLLSQTPGRIQKVEPPFLDSNTLWCR